jgi:hypothetical protein
MLTSDLPVFANASKATHRLRIRPGRESERVKEALPETFRETLKVQRIDTPLSLRHVVQAPAALLKRIVQKEEASAMASLTESLTKAPEINIGKERLRESTSAPYLKLLSAQLPPVLAPRSSAPGSSTKARPKDPLFLRRQMQLHRHAIDFNSGHRIRLLRRTKPSLKPLLV